MADRLVLNYTPIRRDYVAWLLHRFFRNRVMGWIKIIVLVQILLISLVLMYFAVSSGISPGQWPVATWLSAFFLVLCGATVLRQWLFWRKFFSDPNVFVPFKVTLQHSGVHFKTGLADSKLKWESFTTLEENRDYFFLPYRSAKNVGQPIPKRAFETVEQQSIFRTIVAKHLK